MNPSMSDFQWIIDGNQRIADYIKMFRDDKFGGKRYLWHGKEYTELFFHSDFNWIMPVVDLIERLGYDTSVIRKDVAGKITYSFKVKKTGSTEYAVSIDGDSKISILWQGVVKFCETHPHEKPRIKTFEVQYPDRPVKIK